MPRAVTIPQAEPAAVGQAGRSRERTEAETVVMRARTTENCIMAVVCKSVRRIEISKGVLSSGTDDEKLEGHRKPKTHLYIPVPALHCLVFLDLNSAYTLAHPMLHGAATM